MLHRRLALETSVAFLALLAACRVDPRAGMYFSPSDAARPEWTPPPPRPQVVLPPQETPPPPPQEAPPQEPPKPEAPPQEPPKPAAETPPLDPVDEARARNEIAFENDYLRRVLG